MVGIFLVLRAGIFELMVSGPVAADPMSVANAIARLPDCSAVVIDLARVTALEGDGLEAVEDALRERAAAGVRIAITSPASEPAVGVALATALPGAVVGVFGTIEQAEHAIAVTAAA